MVRKSVLVKYVKCQGTCWRNHLPKGWCSPVITWFISPLYFVAQVSMVSPLPQKIMDCSSMFIIHTYPSHNFLQKIPLWGKIMRENYDPHYKKKSLSPHNPSYKKKNPQNPWLGYTEHPPWLGWILTGSRQEDAMGCPDTFQPLKICRRDTTKVWYMDRNGYRYVQITYDILYSCIITYLW